MFQLRSFTRKSSCRIAQGAYSPRHNLFSLGEEGEKGEEGGTPVMVGGSEEEGYLSPGWGRGGERGTLVVAGEGVSQFWQGTPSPHFDQDSGTEELILFPKIKEFMSPWDCRIGFLLLF